MMNLQNTNFRFQISDFKFQGVVDKHQFKK